jgi:hypothetical protein
VDLERGRIFRLLETADNFVKYAATGREERAAERARERYEDALELARRKGDAELVEQVRLRIDDLQRRTGSGVETTEDESPPEDDGRDAGGELTPSTPGDRGVVGLLVF